MLRVLVLFALLCGCGTHDTNGTPARQSGIIGGSGVAPTDLLVRSTVAIINLQTGLLECSGTLIAPNVVLTAGHCVTETAADRGLLFSKDIPQGLLSLATTPNLIAAVGVKSTDAWKVHATQPGRARGDIALLSFKGQVPASYAPAALWCGEELKVGESVAFYGFGLISQEPRILPASLQTTSLKFQGDDGTNTEARFDQSHSTGICNGDSGGPSYVRKDGVWYLFGVNSFTAASCVGHYGYSEVTKVASYASWIRNGIAELSRSAQ